MKHVICTVFVLAMASTTAHARCPTLTGYATFKRCVLTTNTATDDARLRTQFETMLAEDRANARTKQYRTPLEPADIDRDSRFTIAERALGNTRQPAHDHGLIEAEIRHQQRQRQQNSFDAARARNEFQVERGRRRSQNLLYGQGF